MRTQELIFDRAGLTVAEVRSTMSQSFCLTSGDGVLIVVARRSGARVNIREEGRTHAIAKSSQFVIIPAGQSSLWTLEGAHDFLCVRVPLLRSTAVQAVRFRHDPELVRLCEVLRNEALETDAARDESCAALAALVRVHLLRRYVPGHPSARCHKGLPLHKLHKVLDCIETKLTQAIRVEELAAAASFSTHHFCRLFKASTGMTPHHYITARRIERAKVMLREDSLPLVQIALETGFPSQSHFGYVFRKITGVTPKDFRTTQSQPWSDSPQFVQPRH